MSAVVDRSTSKRSATADRSTSATAGRAAPSPTSAAAAAATILRRVGFGPTPADLERAETIGIDRFLDELAEEMRSAPTATRTEIPVEAMP